MRISVQTMIYKWWIFPIHVLNYWRVNENGIAIQRCFCLTDHAHLWTEVLFSSRLQSFLGKLKQFTNLNSSAIEGDDFPKIHHDSRARENSEVVIIYPDLYSTVVQSSFSYRFPMIFLWFPVVLNDIFPLGYGSKPCTPGEHQNSW